MGFLRIFAFLAPIAVLVSVAITVVVVAGGFEVDVIDDVREVVEFALVGKLLDLSEISLVDHTAADDVKGDIRQGADDGGVGQDPIGWAVDDDGIVLLLKVLQQFAQQRRTEQCHGIGDIGAGIEDEQTVRSVFRRVDHRGRILYLFAQDGSQPLAPFPSKFVAEGGFPQVAVNEEYLFPGLGKSGSQVAGRHGLPFSGHGGGDHHDVTALLGPGQKGVDIVAQDVEAFRNHGMIVLNEEGRMFAFLFAQNGQFRQDGKVADSRQVVFVPDFVVEHGHAHKSEDAQGGPPAATNCMVLGEMGRSLPWAVSSTRAEGSAAARARAFSSCLLRSIR